MAQPFSVEDNLVDELSDYNLLGSDPILQAALDRAQAQPFVPALAGYGQTLGRRSYMQLAEQANRHGPELQRYDARGRRMDTVEFHPAWHKILAQYRAQQLIDMPFASEQPGRWSAWAAGFYLHGQIEAGSLCPATMTTASIPVLRKEPALWQAVQAGLASADYDARDVPITGKSALWVGMGMTEMQGGSDVRSNTTVAYPVEGGGRGQSYRLQGHKWFYSVPMADAHMVVARMAGAAGDTAARQAPLACFWVPRWQPDGMRNGVHVLRLKDKLGNRSNASSEVEFHDAYGVLVGEEGRGIATIMEMATITRLCCVLGSSALLRQATVQAIAYARRRHAFGHALAEQPLMQNVLADLALESEAALLLAMQLAQAFEQGDAVSQAWQRIMTPAAKFWVCKRAVACSAEAMEVLGGNGYVETSSLARIYREAPVNSIWEGSGNIMCLDAVKAMQRTPALAESLLHSIQHLADGDARIQHHARALQGFMRNLQADAYAQQAQARLLVQKLVLLAQAALMLRHAGSVRADAFIHTRLDAGSSLGTLGTCALAKPQITAILSASLHLQ